MRRSTSEPAAPTKVRKRGRLYRQQRLEYRQRQCEFAQTATQQYLDQTTNMLSIMTKMTQDFLNPLQELTRQALRDLTKEIRSSKHT